MIPSFLLAKLYVKEFAQEYRYGFRIYFEEHH